MGTKGQGVKNVPSFSIYQWFEELDKVENQLSRLLDEVLLGLPVKCKTILFSKSSAMLHCWHTTFCKNAYFEINIFSVGLLGAQFRLLPYYYAILSIASLFSVWAQPSYKHTRRRGKPMPKKAPNLQHTEQICFAIASMAFTRPNQTPSVWKGQGGCYQILKKLKSKALTEIAFVF